MFCPKCGTQLNDNVKFCGSCGAAINNNSNSISQYNSASQATYIKIKGYRNELDYTINVLKSASILLPLIVIELILYFVSFLYFYAPIISIITIILLIATIVLPIILMENGVLVDTSRGVIIINPRANLNSVKKIINICDIKNIKIENYKLNTYNSIFDLFAPSRDFYNFTFINNQNEKILDLQFVSQQNSSEFIVAIQNMCKDINREDILINN